MKVKALIRFHDTETDTKREIGTEFVVTKERMKKLVDLGYVEAVVEKEPVEEKPRKAEKKG